MGKVDQRRVSRLDEGREPVEGDYVLYWMQAAARTVDNHALEEAAQRANRAELPLLVAFAVDPGYPESSARHHQFLLEGLSDISPALQKRNVGWRLLTGNPPDVIAGLADRAREVVVDRGYLRIHRQWRSELVAAVIAPVTEVDSNLVVPVDVASDKQEYAARTLRPKIHRHLDEFLEPLDTVTLTADGRHLTEAFDLSDIPRVLRDLEVDDHVPASSRFQGGQDSAASTLERFLDKRLSGYDDGRGEPSIEATSGLSPFLHFGHVSPLTVILAAQESGATGTDYDTLLEELVVRRELSHNYVWFQDAYDSLGALPDWVGETFDRHRDDPREHIYSRNELERGETHDAYWNAAMIEMRETGYLHNYMRMYWGKQIIFWSRTPEEAYDTAISLNNQYLLDGRDPNSYAGVGWCFGLHDRGWPEREIIGKVRTMTAAGLERKKDMEGYLALVSELTGIDVRGPGASRLW